MGESRAEVKPRRAGLYLRISEDRTGREAGVRRQENEGRQLCGRLGWQVIDLYVDNDVSAYTGRQRPEYERLKSDLRAGRVDAIVAWHPDRLYRRSRDLLDLIDLVNEMQAEIATVTANSIDLSTANGRLVAKIGADVAQHESEHKAERTRAWHRQRAEAGLPSGGRRPYGYEKGGMTVRPDEAALIREAADRIIAGERRWTIISDWNRRGVPTVTGTPWTTVVLGGILRSPRIAGFRQHLGTLHPAAWPAILVEDTWKAVGAALRVERATPGRPAVYLLTGVAVCGLCATRMTGNRTSTGVRIYRCPPEQSSSHGCGRVGRDAAKLETHVRDRVIDALAGPRLAAALATVAADDQTTRTVLGELDRLEGRLAELQHDYAVEGLHTKPEFVRLKQTLTGRIANVKRQLDMTRRHPISSLPADVEGLIGWWEQAQIDDQRAVVQVLVEQITVLPTVRGGRTFDPTRIQITWRD
jgi:DNA invertase Pin-like site-specific DNA recombinase